MSYDISQRSLSRVILVISALFFSLHCSFAGDNRYPVSAIPADLLKNADMVVRLSETVLEIGSLTKATEKIHLVYTVLRESALEKASLHVYYDNDSRITRLEGRMYDASGSEIKRFRSDDIIDQSAVPSGTLYSDDRVKFIAPVSSRYPFTVEYVFERSSRQMMQYPQWRGVDDYQTAVESASLVIYADRVNRPRTLTVNFPGQGEWPMRNSDSSMRWHLENLPALVHEPLCTDVGKYIPLVYIAPSMVTIPDQNPEPASWKSYGMWVNRLNRDRGILPEQVVNKIWQLTSSASDSLVKLKKVYQYFQENTRYISVQIGIGGYQPADALSVARNGYGDCKALVNYMKALLESAGISSYYTLVMAGERAVPLRSDFPALQFNHAILCVPIAKDTVWLECTSQTIPFGFLGSFTSDREVLIVTPAGGVLAHTPGYPKEMNRMQRYARIEIDSTCFARVSVTTKVSGLQYELFDSRLHESPEEQKKSVRDDLGLSAVSITNLRYLEEPGLVPQITETLDFTMPAFATITGNRLFIPLNTFNKQPLLPPIEEPRKFSFYGGYGYMDSDSILLVTPAGFTVDFLPEEVKVTTTYGSYESITTSNPPGITYVRHMSKEGDEFPASEYAAYHAFIRQISKADKGKAILRK